jgi:general secretion pathway protein L
MILRLLVPPVDRLGPDAPFDWALAERGGTLLREGRSALAEVPRGDTVEAVLPASRVLFARLALPKVNAATIRELLPYAVEDRLLADPSHIHAVPGASNARGETLVAVVDRQWLGEALGLLARAGLSPSRVVCESALATPGPQAWAAVLGAERCFLVEDDGYAVAFDRPAGDAPPLALRIAVDEATGREAKPAGLEVLAEPGFAPAHPQAWSEALGLAVRVRESKGRLALPVSPRAIDLLTGEFARRSRALSGLRLPRLAYGLAAALVVLQLGLAGFDTLRLERERRALEAERESLFRSAFPEATTVVDPALQMARNLAALKRARGEASSDDFLAQVTRASQDDPAPASKLTWASGRLAVDRAAPPKREAPRADAK